MTKLPVKIALTVLCLALVLAMPFVVSSPAMLGDAMWAILEEGEDSGFVSLLIPAARAEVVTEEAPALPVDFTPGPAPDPACFNENGYEDDSIRVQMETREEDGVVYRIAWVEIASPTQLRTGIAGDKVTSKKTGTVLTLAERYNAVVAMNGDYFVDNPTKTSFEYRMGQKVRAKTNRLKDILIIDQNGDFHTFVKSQGITVEKNEVTAEGVEGPIINAFTFGPALVQKGQLLTCDKDYGYNPNGREPRSAIGQLDKLSYVMVIAEGRGESAGVTHQELADFMYSLGCIEAFNLDGGGTACMALPFHPDQDAFGANNGYYNELGGKERPQSDIIYFATAAGTESGK